MRSATRAPGAAPFTRRRQGPREAGETLLLATTAVCAEMRSAAHAGMPLSISASAWHPRQGAAAPLGAPPRGQRSRRRMDRRWQVFRGCSLFPAYPVPWSDAAAHRSGRRRALNCMCRRWAMKRRCMDRSSPLHIPVGRFATSPRACRDRPGNRSIPGTPRNGALGSARPALDQRPWVRTDKSLSAEVPPFGARPRLRGQATERWLCYRFQSTTVGIIYLAAFASPFAVSTAAVSVSFAMSCPCAVSRWVAIDRHGPPPGQSMENKGTGIGFEQVFTVHHACTAQEVVEVGHCIDCPVAVDTP